MWGCVGVCGWVSVSEYMIILIFPPAGSSGSLNGARAGESPSTCHQVPRPHQCLRCPAREITTQGQ